MPIDLPLRCSCGAFRGVARVARERGNRVVCYCDDCRAFARFLGREDILDAHGGTDVFHLSTANGASSLSMVALLAKDYLRMNLRLLDEVDAMFADRIEDKLPALEQPLLFVRGEHDKVAPADWVNELAAMSGARPVEVIEGAGHAAQSRGRLRQARHAISRRCTAPQVRAISKYVR